MAPILADQPPPATPCHDATMTTREIESLAQLDAVLGAPAGQRPLAGLRIQGVDLAARESELLRCDPSGAVVLGGNLTDRLEEHLRHGGALVFPAASGAPIDPYRSRLYDATELYAGLAENGYAATPDARAYAWWLDASVRSDVYVTLLRSIHDDSIGDALDEACAGRRVVGVMGGHAVQRGEPAYDDAARLGRDLARAGILVATGGGPGAMEAANLGARCADRSDDRLEHALRRVAAVPSFRPDVTAWAALGLTVRDEIGEAHQLPSVGVPTWFYGHEPPNVFAGLIAKFFSNALREDGLLARCTDGVIYLPGAAGTVQEVFQAATGHFYAEAPLAPLVLVGRRAWTEELPVWPLLTALAADRAMDRTLHLVDTVAEAAAIFR
jgi:predicted Rossmann-fold nucleotide-binding protein